MEPRVIVPILDVVQQPKLHAWPDDHDICVANAIHDINAIINNEDG